MNKQEVITHARKFLDQLELPEENTTLAKAFKPGAAAFQDDTAGAAVDAGSLVSFVSGVSSMHKSDVLNSTLLAQLAASKKFDRYQAPINWYNFYVNVLSQIGWVVPAFAFRNFTPSNPNFAISEAVLDILGPIATGSEVKILQAALDSLRDNSNNQGALTFFDSQCYPEDLGTFQIFPVSEDRGQLVMALSAMQFHGEKHVTRFLWWSWSSLKVSLQQSAQKAVLNEDLYRQVRQQVIDKLGIRASQFIADLDI